MSRVLIKGGWVVDPASGLDGQFDVLVEGENVAKVAPDISSRGFSGGELISASDKVVTPGFIDLHAHLREPGREDEETIETGVRAAVKGGFTTLAAMANTEPRADKGAVIRFVKETADRIGMTRVLPVAAVTVGLEGRRLTELAELRRAGAAAFSDDGASIMEAGLMRRALEYTKMLKAPVIAHAEDRNLAADGQINEGYYSTLLGLPPAPAAAEDVMVARDLILAEMTQGKLHIGHVSTRRSVELIREAKNRGVQVTCEVTPHHLALTDACLINFDTNLKVNPPLRSAEDVKALKEGLADGTIDAIATDHAPHSREEKEREFALAPFGIIGLETAFAVAHTELVKGKVLTLAELVVKLTAGPAHTLGLSPGALAAGAPADIAIIDAEATQKIDVEKFESKSRNSPFNGWELSGVVTDVVCRGRIALSDGQIGQKVRKKRPKSKVETGAPTNN